MIFYNKHYLTKQNFEIKNSSIKIERKHMFEAVEYEMPFDVVTNKTTTQTIINNNMIVLGLFIFGISLLFLFGTNSDFTFILMFISFLLIIISFLNRKKVITIVTMDGNNIELYFTASNKDEVSAYAKEIINAANHFLLKKYSKIDKALPIDPQIENIQYLLSREIISEEQFESLKNQLLGTEKRSIGFGLNN